MPKLMVIRSIMCLGAVLLSTAPISQAFAQAQQQETQASGIAVEDSSSSAESDNLQLLRPGATAIFPKGDSIPVADSASAVPAAALSEGARLAIFVLIVVVLIYTFKAWAFSL